MNNSKVENVVVMKHPLLTHKISKIRDVHTNTKEFRELVKEIAAIECLEALKDLSTHDVEITTPLEKTIQPMISPEKICFVPILRAGLGMVDGVLSLVPEAKVGHIGLYRDETTHLPHEYYCKLPDNVVDLDVYLIDPMLATGGSAIDAVNMLKSHGVTNIKAFICLIAAPEGMEAFHNAFPEIKLIIGSLDRCLNEKAYICPGLGDAGDRIFGTNITSESLRK